MDKQFRLSRSKGVAVFEGDPSPRYNRHDLFKVFCGFSFAQARRRAHEEIQRLYPDKPMRRFALSETSHGWLVQEPHTGEPVELFVLQPS